MQPWFIATEQFAPDRGSDWERYIAWSGLLQLDELVSLDPMLCRTVLPEIKPSYWPHIVNEDFMLSYFTDLEFLLEQITGLGQCNLLCVYRDPPAPPPPYRGALSFEFLGYDLVDVQGGASALSNCGGFPDVFANSELSCKGLFTSHSRALEVQAELRSKYPDGSHTDCYVWAIARAQACP